SINVKRNGGSCATPADSRPGIRIPVLSLYYYECPHIALSEHADGPHATGVEGQPGSTAPLGRKGGDRPAMVAASSRWLSPRTHLLALRLSQRSEIGCRD